VNKSEDRSPPRNNENAGSIWVIAAVRGWRPPPASSFRGGMAEPGIHGSPVEGRVDTELNEMCHLVRRVEVTD
jgi:hypothetical protein